MRFIKIFLLLVILAAMALFLLQNSALLEQEFVFSFKLYIADYSWLTPPLPFFFVSIVAFILGGLLAVLMLGIDRLRLFGQIRQSNRKIKMLEKELRALRELPLVSNIEHNETQQLPAAD